jgi:hypothetical protein
MKLSSKTKTSIFLGMALILSVVGGYFLFFNDNEIERSWYESNWSYRRTIYISDIPTEYQKIPQDILVEVDTEVLIGEQKLLNDCRDIRFIDNDNSTTLPYWIEGGCNTKKTQIWVNIPATKSSEKNIYMYYGNREAVDNQEPWDGEFITLSVDNCIENWSNNNVFEGRFLLASSEFGKTGGTNSHMHNLVSSEDNCDNPVYIADAQGSNSCDTTQDNIVSQVLTDSSNIPNYQNITMCSSKNGFLNTSSIIISEQDTPSTWTHISMLDNKFPRGESSDNPQISLTHTHEAQCINTSLEEISGHEKYLKLNTISATESIDKQLPYTKVNFISPQESDVIAENIIMMVSSIPPLGWNSYTQFNDTFILGSNNDFMSTGGEKDHSHITNIFLSKEITTPELLNKIKTTSICITDENLSLPTTVSDMYPPYLTVIFAQKKENLVDVSNFIMGEEEKGEVLGTIGSGPSQPTALETEGETNPTDIIAPTPGFTAIFNHPDYP